MSGNAPVVVSVSLIIRGESGSRLAQNWLPYMSPF
jgi:hypothetical protein